MSGRGRGSWGEADRGGASVDVRAIVANVAIRVAVVVAVVLTAWAHPITDADVARFSELATAPGVPYRDYAVEYAPGELAVIRLIGAADLRGTAVRLVVACFALDLLAFAGMWRGWGSAAAVRYLWLGVPLLTLRYLRLWYLPVAVAVWGFVLLRRGRPLAAAIVAALAAFVKLWPLALAPVVVDGARRRAVAYAGALATGAAAWLALGGPDGIREVASFRSATGWEIESTIGSLVWIFGAEPRWEAGAVRVGSTGSLTWVAAAVLLVVLALVWRRARRWPGDPLGAPSVAALCAVLACSPLFSLQYVGWLTPWAAVASADRDRLPAASAWAIVLLTGGVAVTLFRGGVHLDGLDATLGQVMLVARNALCALVPAWFVLRSRDRRELPTAVA